MSRFVVLLLLAGCAASPEPPSPTHGASTPALEVALEASRTTTSASASAESRGALERPPPRPTAPAGYVEVVVATVVPADEGFAVLLLDEARRTGVPIFIGGTEAQSIHLRSIGQAPPRPLTHDLLDSVMRELGGTLVKVQVDELRDDGVFIGSIFVYRQGKTTQLDARPSDAIALAIGARVPIFVREEVLQAAGIREDDLRPPPPATAAPTSTAAPMPRPPKRPPGAI